MIGILRCAARCGQSTGTPVAACPVAPHGQDTAGRGWLEVAHLTAVDLQVGSGFEWTSSIGAHVCDEVVNFHSLQEGGTTLLDELNVLVVVHFKVPVLHLGAIVLECRETCHNLEFHLLS